MTGYNPDSWLDILGLVVLAGAFIGAAAVPAWISHRSQNKKLGAIEEQVVNNHGKTGLDRNLRKDIDRIIEAVDATREDVAELRGELKGLTHRVDELGKPSIVRPRTRSW